MECIGKRKGKPHKPYEFGVKVSVATTLKHSKGGQTKLASYRREDRTLRRQPEMNRPHINVRRSILVNELPSGHVASVEAVVFTEEGDDADDTLDLVAVAGEW